MKYLVFKLFLSLILFISPFVSGVSAQISQPSTPWSKIFPLNTRVWETEIPNPDIQQLIAEDTIPEKSGTFYRVGIQIPLRINPFKMGTWDEIPGQGLVWRIVIHCNTAKAISLYFTDFQLPDQGRLFVYGTKTRKLLGAFTSFNNHESGIFATDYIEGENVILEYNQDGFNMPEKMFELAELGFFYRGVGTNQNKSFGDSESCEVNVNCSPEGDNWQAQKRGVVRVSLVAGGNMGFCSGSVINNTAQDCTPYILTADHCGGDATTSEYLQWVFYFNYESPDCSNPASEGTLASQSMSGCELVAHGGAGGTAGSDFHLLKLNDDIPDAYNTYFNGWNRIDQGAISGVSIHHPSADIKKISTYNSTLTTSDWNGSGYPSHWTVTWIATTNGHGVTEGGSSGSPIFDQDGLIVGDLTGGSSYCSTPTSPDRYGKLSYSWESNGSTAQEQLKPWLDPINSGDSILQGREPCTASGLYADFSWQPSVVVSGMNTDFIDESIGANIQSWTWSFQSGTPASSSIQNPTGIVFQNPGVYQVILTISNGTANDTRIKQVNVVSPSPPIADFTATQTTVQAGDSVYFLDLSIGGPTQWNWTFAGGTPSVSTDQNPGPIVYNTSGQFLVSLTTQNPFGSDFETKYDYITVTDVIPSIEYCDTISNLLPFDSLMVYQQSAFGMIPGHNQLQIKEYADHFAVTQYDYIEGFVVPVFVSSSVLNSATVRFKVWEGGNHPGTVLAYKEVYLSSLPTNQYSLVYFDNPVMVSGDFYVGFELSYYLADNYTGPDNFSVFMADSRGQNGLNTLQLKYNNQWIMLSDLPELSGFTTSLGIEPVACANELSAGNFKNDPELVLFPNPANEKLSILLKDKVMDRIGVVKLFSASGSLVYTAKFISGQLNSIETQRFLPGVYILTINFENRNYIRKLIIE